jgi:hypothetical protein
MSGMSAHVFSLPAKRCFYPRHSAWIPILLAGTIASAQGYQHEIAVKWNFAAASNALGWYPAAPLSNFGIHNGSLTFTTTAQDTSIFSPSISAAGASMQLVEIVMKSNLAGPSQLSWASSADGGFQPGDESQFNIAGDDAPHHYYLPINTQAGTTIYQLELSVPPGATIDIQSVDIAALVEPSGSGGIANWRFTADGNSLGWIPYSGIVDMSVSNGDLHLKTFANATILAPKAQISNQLEWFSLFGRVLHTTLESPWVQFNFVSDQNNGNPTVVYFPLATDSASHVYNENLGGANGWWSHVSQLSITVAENTDLDISEMSVSNAPHGPEDLVVDSFGPATPLLRAGTEFRVSCRVWDRGAAPGERLTVKLNLPGDGSVRVVSSPKAAASVASGYPQTLVWTLLAKEPGEVPISITAESESSSAEASTMLLINPKVATQKASYIPPPQPAASEYNIGAYYFPGWSLDSHWDPIRSFPQRMPALGYYAEGDPQVLDWQIKWAAEHGIKFFAVDWYWNSSGGAAPPGEIPNGFLRAYAAASYRDSMKFCIAYADGEGSAVTSVGVFEIIAKAWIKKYFSQPGYLKIDGKPVVFIIGPGLLDANLGGSAAQALDEARQLAKTAGLGGIYFIADTGPSQVGEFVADGYDALSAYNYPGVGTNDPDESPFNGLVSAYPGVWDTIIDSSSIPYLIPTIRGWDPRPWQYYNAPEDLVRPGSTPELFESMLQQAKSRIDAGRAPHVLMVEAWNELGEGSAIEPTAGDGFGYLDAIRNVFVSNSAHTDLAPSDVGLPVVQVQPATSLMTFTSPADLAPWQVSLGRPYWDWTTGITGSKIANNQWTLSSNGYGDVIRMGFELSAQRYSGLAITMSTSVPAYVTVYWGADDEPGPSAVRNASFSANPGPMRTYTIPLAGLTGWRGNINLLRLTFSNSTAAKVAIQSIQFLPADGASTFALSRSQMEFHCQLGATAPAPQILSIAGGVKGKLDWIASAENAGWLSLSQARGTVPGNITLSIHPAGLKVGVYTTGLKISASGAGGGSASVPVTLWVMPKAAKPANALVQ